MGFEFYGYKLLIVFVLANLISHHHGVSSVSLKIPQGLLKGKALRSREGREFYGFMGIPYAQAPERFQAAKLPPPKWEEDYDATDYRTKCAQFNFTTQISEGSEDCLYINVFTPKLGIADTENLSVLAFIHGGGFQFGLAYENGPEFLLDHDVVFVTFSYRLAALGFLSTGDDVLPGNLGLKDQNLALKWIQENIQYFGGDKDKVTLTGESAGSASVSLHILSNLSRGMFRHAICQSGSALDRWPVIENPKEVAMKLADKLSCSTASSREILECLKTKDVEEIVNVQLRTSIVESLIMYGPVLENDNFGDSPAFLTALPGVLYKEGNFAKVPMLMTVNDLEGLLVNALAVLESSELLREFNENWESTALTAFVLDKDYYTNSAKQWAALRLREFYFGGKSIGRETMINLTNLYSDCTFIHRTRTTALIHGEHAPVYASVLAFKGIWSQTFFLGFKEILGMTHADDLSYLFTDFKYPPFPPKSESEHFSKLLVKLWVNFAKNGDPGFEINGRKWLPVDSAAIKTQVITWLYLKNQPEFLHEPLQQRMAVWDEIDRVLETGVIPDPLLIV